MFKINRDILMMKVTKIISCYSNYIGEEGLSDKSILIMFKMDRNTWISSTIGFKWSYFSWETCSYHHRAIEELEFYKYLKIGKNDDN